MNHKLKVLKNNLMESIASSSVNAAKEVVYWREKACCKRTPYRDRLTAYKRSLEWEEHVVNRANRLVAVLNIDVSS